MNIQIFGTKKCSDTRKAQRFFNERRIQFHFVDLSQKEMSRGELRAVAVRVPLVDIIDTKSTRFLEKGLVHASLNPAYIETLLVQDSLLMRTPIVRNGKEVTVGHSPDVWKTWE